MKITQEVSPVTTGGKVGEAKQFKINASREAFQILSSGLYNDKVAAILRELACNSYDSHVAAGKKDVQFEIHLPTRWEPFFRIKDFGEGLSNEHLEELYTTYFGTSRNQSNDYVGEKGLGSKSPFSYTKVFSVESRHKGKTRSYSASLDDGLPNIRQMGDEIDSTEPDGLTVQFSVEPGDIEEFQGKAAKVFEFFDPLPKFNMEVKIQKKDYFLRTERWGLRKPEGYTYGVQARAIQGMVSYSIGVLEQSKLTNEQQLLSQLPLDLFFPIGHLSVAASRETLSNDEFTVNNIIKTLQDVMDSLIEEVKKKIEVCSVMWEARLLLFNLTNINILGNLVSNAISKGAFLGQYKNFYLGSADTEVLEATYPNIKTYYFRQNRTGVYATKALHSHETITPTSKVRFNVGPEVAFVINDVGFGAGKYVHHFLQESGDCKYTKLYYIDRASQYASPSVVLKEGRKLVDELGKPPVFILSELKSKVRTTQVYTKKEIQRLKEGVSLSRSVNGYDNKRWREAWTEPDLPLLPGSKYYVRLSRGAPVGGEFDFADELIEFVSNVRKSKMFDFKDDTPLYGLANDFFPGKSWVPFLDYVYKELDQKMDKKKELEMSLHVKPFYGGFHNLINDVTGKKSWSLLDPNSPFLQFSNELTEAQKAHNNSEEEIKALGWLLRRASSKITYRMGEVINFNEKFEKLLLRYPMLTVCASYSQTMEQIIKLAEYIRLIDMTHPVKKEEEVA